MFQIRKMLGRFVKAEVRLAAAVLMEIWDLISDAYVLRVVLSDARDDVTVWLVFFSIACFVSLVNLHVKAWLFFGLFRERREEFALEAAIHCREVEIDDAELQLSVGCWLNHSKRGEGSLVAKDLALPKPFTVRFEDDEQHSYNSAQMAAKFKLVVYGDKILKTLSKHKTRLRKTVRSLEQLQVVGFEDLSSIA